MRHGRRKRNDVLPVPLAISKATPECGAITLMAAKTSFALRAAEGAFSLPFSSTSMVILAVLGGVQTFISQTFLEKGLL